MRTWLLCLFAGSALLCAQNGDLRGVWKADGKAYLNLETAGVIVDPPSGKLPYRAEARAKVAENAARRASADPDTFCFQPGVPRGAIMQYPFQILQNDRAVYIVYQRVHSYRILYLDGKPHNEGLPYAMGDSRAHWEGATLVADVLSFSDQTWLDAAGHFHSEDMHVVERYTRTSPETIAYEATIEDPKVFTMPWKLRLTLRRQPGGELVEDECDVDSNGTRHHVSPFRHWQKRKWAVSGKARNLPWAQGAGVLESPRPLSCPISRGAVRSFIDLSPPPFPELR